MIALKKDTLQDLPQGLSPSLHRGPFKHPSDPTSHSGERDSDVQKQLESSSLMDNVVPVDRVKNPVALDFDDREDMLYWTDVESRTISRAHLNGSSHQLLAEHNLGEDFRDIISLSVTSTVAGIENYLNQSPKINNLKLSISNDLN